MFSRFHNRKGFTLIELMIVVVIIGILAALAIPRFMKATAKSKQSEAKQILKQVYTMQRTYRQANDTYGDAGVTAAADGEFPDIGVDIMASAIYSYTMTTADADGFLCTATGNIDDDDVNDVWTIDNEGDLLNTTDDVQVEAVG